jgi:hypothetical protein
MGGNNFPAPAPGPVGVCPILATGSSFGPTNVFTASVSGLYAVSPCSHIITTNNAGSISLVLATPHISNLQTFSPSLAGGTDSQRPARLAWLNAGESITLTGTFTGTLTTLQIFISIIRML